MLNATVLKNICLLFWTFNETKSLFLDRDGTLNVEKEYLIKAEDFAFERGVIDTLRKLSGLGYLLFIVTNQSGIARGYFSEENLQELNIYVLELLKQQGIDIQKIVYCPHHPSGTVKEYARVCDCRKPGNKLLEQLIKEYDIDREHSYMVGDKAADIQAGSRSGLKTILVGTGYGSKTKESFTEFDHFAPTFASILDLI